MTDRYENHLDWLDNVLNPPIPSFTLRRWRYDIPRFAGTHKPPSAFSSNGEPTGDDLLDMEFWPLYKRYRCCNDDHDMAKRSSRRRWHTLEQTEDCLQRIASYKRQLEFFEHLLRTFHFMEWMQQIQREQMYLQQERESRLTRSRDYEMER